MVKNRISLIATFIWLICALFYTYEFLLRTILGTFEHQLIIDLNLNVVTFAILSSTSYLIIYGLMQIPVGLLIDRFGLKAVLTFASFICSLSVFGFAIIHQFGSALSMRLLMGFGSSFGFICLLTAVYDWLPQKNIAFFIGISQLIGTMGPMLAAGPMSSLTNHAAVSWRQIFHILGCAGLVLTVAIFFIVRKNKQYRRTFQILKCPKPLSEKISLLYCVNHKCGISQFILDLYILLLNICLKIVGNYF